jgi:hypothetical protein
MKLSGSSSRSFIGPGFTLGMLIPPGRGRYAALLLPVGLAFGLVATACGGGSSKPASTTTSPPTTAAAASSPAGGGAGGRGQLNSQLAAFRTCMASHGEPLPTFAPRTTTTQGPGAGGAAPANGGSAPPDNGGGPGRGGGFFIGGGGGNGLGFVLRGLNQNDPAVMAAYNACKGQIPASLIQAQQQRSQQLNAFISCMSDHGVTISTGAPAAGTPRTTIDQNSPAYQTCKVLLPNGGAFGPRGSTTTTTAS